MTIGASIFLIVVGAILKFAMNVEVAQINLDTVGVILMIAGGAGLILGFVQEGMARKARREAQARAAQQREVPAQQRQEVPYEQQRREPPGY